MKRLSSSKCEKFAVAYTPYNNRKWFVCVIGGEERILVCKMYKRENFFKTFNSSILSPASVVEFWPMQTDSVSIKIRELGLVRAVER